MIQKQIRCQAKCKVLLNSNISDVCAITLWNSFRSPMESTIYRRVLHKLQIESTENKIWECVSTLKIHTEREKRALHHNHMNDPRPWQFALSLATNIEGESEDAYRERRSI
jgi:hypothetical protein